MGKSALVARPVVEARMRHRMAPSRFSAPLLWFGRLLLPPYLRFVLNFSKIECLRTGDIVDALRDFQEKRTRLIVAFRHPYGDEPQLLFHVFENLIPRWAKRLGTPLARKTHIRLVHDYAVPLWGGAFIRFLLPRVGAVPVYHVKFDPVSLKNIRTMLNDDPCPTGLAPEGQISYHGETLPRIEQGTVRLGFWCARDIGKAGRSERVMVLPLSIHYRYDLRDAGKIREAVRRVGALCGLSPSGSGAAGEDRTAYEDLLPRVEAVEGLILEIAEAFYEKTYGYRPPDSAPPAAGGAETRLGRWAALQDAALGIAEHALGIDPKNEDIVQRMYRVRLEGWDRIYPESFPDSLSPIERALAHRRAGEAWFAMGHMELVDLMSYHDAGYLRGGGAVGPSFDRLVETVLNLEDLAARLMGGNISNRPNDIRKKAVLVPGPCLDLTARLPDYCKDSRLAVREATDELARRFEDCIKEYLNEHKC